MVSPHSSPHFDPALFALMYGAVQGELDPVWEVGALAWLYKNARPLSEAISSQEVLVFRELKLAAEGRATLDEVWVSLTIWRDLLLCGLADYQRVQSGQRSCFAAPALELINTAV